MHHSAGGVLSYFAIFGGIYLIIWLSQYWSIRRRLKQVNDQLSRPEP